jgi:hypothetical protein
MCLLELISNVDPKYLDRDWRPWVELAEYQKHKDAGGAVGGHAVHKPIAHEKPRGQEKTESAAASPFLAAFLKAKEAKADSAAPDAANASGSADAAHGKSSAALAVAGAADSAVEGEAGGVLPFEFAPREESEPLPEGLPEYVALLPPFFSQLAWRGVAWRGVTWRGVTLAYWFDRQL